MSRFASATAVSATGAGSFSAEIQPGWDIVGAANGGYLLAIAARALLEATERPDVVTVGGHFLRPGVPGPLGISTDIVSARRRFSTATTHVEFEGETMMIATGVTGSLETVEAPRLVTGAPPDLPPPDECMTVEPTDTFPPPFVGQVELRVPPDVQFGASGEAAISGWFRLRDGEPMDTLALVCAADAFPPAVFFSGLPIAWVPTIELTVQIRRRPVAEWVACRFVTRFVSDGYLEEDGELWSPDGELLALSRQLALTPRS